MSVPANPTDVLVSAIAEQVVARLAALSGHNEARPKVQPKYLTYETAGQFMDMPAETVRSLVKQKRLPASRDGGIVRIAVSDIADYMDRHRV